MTRAAQTLRGGERGLTLVEILLAVSIIGVAVAGLAIVVPVSLSGVHHGNQLSTATFLAEQGLERARAATWTAEPPVDCLGTSSGDVPPAPAGASCPGVLGTRFPDETAVSGYPHYRRTVRVTSCEATPCAGVTTAGLRRVEVNVDYTPLTGGGAPPGGRTVRLTWLVAQK